MATTIHVRNVPDEVHRKLKGRAALAGMSLSAYALAELQRGLDQPTTAEMMQRLKGRVPASVRPKPADVVREERERR